MSESICFRIFDRRKCNFFISLDPVHYQNCLRILLTGLLKKKLFFISSSECCWAFSLLKSEWGHKVGFVFLSDYVKDQDEKSQAFWIAHEIAHQKLKHKNPFFGKITFEQGDKNEEEADKLARKWLCYPNNFQPKSYFIEQK